MPPAPAPHCLGALPEADLRLPLSPPPPIVPSASSFQPHARPPPRLLPPPHPARLLLQNKLLASEIAQAIGATAMEVEGASASLYLGDNSAPAGGQWPMAYMNSYGMTIAAGTSEVQRNILGERVLGLAKSK